MKMPTGDACRHFFDRFFTVLYDCSTIRIKEKERVNGYEEEYYF